MERFRSVGSERMGGDVFEADARFWEVGDFADGGFEGFWHGWTVSGYGGMVKGEFGFFVGC